MSGIIFNEIIQQTINYLLPNKTKTFYKNKFVSEKALKIYRTLKNNYNIYKKPTILQYSKNIKN